jgi:phosphoglycolate phosphatase
MTLVSCNSVSCNSVSCNSVVFENVDAIVFDKDGTLANSQNFLIHLAEKRAACVEAEVAGLEQQVLQAFGVENGQISLAGLMAVGTRDETESAIATLIAQTGHAWSQAHEIACMAFLKADQLLPRKADFTPPFVGIPELLETCRSLKLGILSNDTEENVRDFVDRYHLTSFFQLQMGARPGLSKPDPQLLELACKALGVSPRNTLVIGDAIADIDLAHCGGAIGCIGVTWGGATPTQLSAADTIAHHTSDINLFA